MNVLPKILNEIRDDPTVDAMTAGRVRGFEPAPGDSKPKGSYQRFVVLVQLDDPRARRSPTQRAIIAARCYGTAPGDAGDLRWAVSNAIHEIGPRIHSNGLGIYLSWEESGGEEEKDPNTQQPYQTIVIHALATTVAVGA